MLSDGMRWIRIVIISSFLLQLSDSLPVEAQTERRQALSTRRPKASASFHWSIRPKSALVLPTAVRSPDQILVDKPGELRRLPRQLVVMRGGDGAAGDEIAFKSSKMSGFGAVYGFGFGVSSLSFEAAIWPI